MIAPKVATPKPDLDAKGEKKHDFEGFLIRLSIGESQAPKCRTLAEKSPW